MKHSSELFLAFQAEDGSTIIIDQAMSGLARLFFGKDILKEAYLIRRGQSGSILINFIDPQEPEVRHTIICRDIRNLKHTIRRSDSKTTKEYHLVDSPGEIEFEPLPDDQRQILVDVGKGNYLYIETYKYLTSATADRQWPMVYYGPADNLKPVDPDIYLESAGYNDFIFGETEPIRGILGISANPSNNEFYWEPPNGKEYEITNKDPGSYQVEHLDDHITITFK